MDRGLILRLPCGLFVLGLEDGPGSWVEFLRMGCVQGLGPSSGILGAGLFSKHGLELEPRLGLGFGV